MWLISVTLALEILRQKEYYEFEVSLGRTYSSIELDCRVRPYQGTEGLRQSGEIVKQKFKN